MLWLLLKTEERGRDMLSKNPNSDLHNQLIRVPTVGSGFAACRRFGILSYKGGSHA